MALFNAKVGDEGSLIPYEVGRDVSTGYQVLVTARDAETGSTVYSRRDISAYQVAPAEGQIVIPLFNGKGLPTVRSAPVAIAAGNVYSGTVPAGPAGTITQHVYMTRVNDPGGNLYLAASFPDGTFSGSPLVLGDPEAVPGAGVTISGYPAGLPTADAQLLLSLPKDQDESATHGDPPLANAYSVVASAFASTDPAPAVASAAATTPGQGKVDAGDHEFVLVNARDPDALAEAVWEFEVILVELASGREESVPACGFDRLEICEGL